MSVPPRSRSGRRPCTAAGKHLILRCKQNQAFMESYYEQAASAMQEALDLRNKAVQDFLKHILIGAVSLFGILLSLCRTDTFAIGSIRWVFSASVLLLSLGILFGSISLYSEASLRIRVARAVRLEVQRVMRQRTACMQPVSVDPLRIFSICTVASYISLGLSVVGLGISFVLEIILH